ncbi:TonB-dependent receptor [Thalassotalea maritima]|uniref:TonB-dependent receptor n=1 Tax=Thalassotalea maritima TaxID=3242416 RepID=UPI003528C489
MHNYNVLSLSVALALGSVTMAHANEEQAPVNENGKLEVIEVTAQKRVQNLQELPTAVSVFNSDSLAEKGVTDVEDLSVFAPNVQISEAPGGSNTATIAIRGSVTINPAITWEPTVGVYVDGVFVSKNVGGLFDVAAIDRVEILRGPQGTLYGKNTIGGAINIVTRQPSGEFEGEVRLGVGNYGLKDYYLTANSATINDNLSFSITANKKQRDGFQDNLSMNSEVHEFKQLDSTALRFAALYEPRDDLTLHYTFDSSDKDLTPPMGQVNIPAIMPDDSKERKDSAALDGVQYDRSKSSGHALTISWDVNDSVTLKSISATRDIDYADGNDYDGFDLLGFHTLRDVEHEQFSQELQLLGNYQGINYVGGLFYLDEESDVSNPFILGFGTVNNFYGIDAQSIAAYVHADYKISDKITVAGGIRWTEEEKDFYVEHPDDFSQFWFFPLPYTTASDTWTNVSGMASVSYELNRDAQTYVKVSQGWKAGGFNGEAANPELATKPYEDEEVVAYEWGIKSRLFDERLQANIAAFYNDVTNLQMSEFLGAYSDIQNAGSAKIKGVELETILAITDNLTANFNFSLLSSDYQEFITYNVFTGEPNDVTDSAEFPYSPEQKWSLGLNYERDVEFGYLRASVDYSYVGDHFAFHNQPSADFTRIESYRIANARITVEDIAGSAFTLSLWGQNILDEEYRINGVPMADATGTFIGGINYYGNPATYGLELSYGF